MSAVQSSGEPIDSPEWPRPAIAWYAVIILMLAYTFSYIDRTILSLLVDPIRRDLDISDTQISLLHGLAFALFYTIMGIPIARWADRGNRRNIVAWGVCVWSLLTAVCGLAKNFWQLFLARVGVGVGEAALSPAAYSMIADLFPKEKLGRALGVYAMGVFFGVGLAYIIGGAVIGMVAALPPVSLPVIGEIRPWQMTFFAVGLPGLLVALLILTIREPERRASARRAPSIVEVVEFFRHNKLTFVCHFAGFSMLTMLYNGIFAWAPTFFIRTYDFTASQAGYYLGLQTLVFGTSGILTGGILADRLVRRGYSDGTIRTGILAAVALAPFAVTATLAPNATLSLLLFCPLTFFISFPFGAAAAGLQSITPNQMRAQISAMYLFIVNLIGIGAGPTVTALITDYVFKDDQAVRYSMSAVSAVGSLGAVLILWIGLRPFRESAARVSAAAPA